ncbi:hypothetical protein KCU66_g69, partial [Aureobasidium melanogenum]
MRETRFTLTTKHRLLNRVTSLLHRPQLHDARVQLRPLRCIWRRILYYATILASLSLHQTHRTIFISRIDCPSHLEPSKYPPAPSSLALILNQNRDSSTQRTAVLAIYSPYASMILRTMYHRCLFSTLWQTFMSTTALVAFLSIVLITITRARRPLQVLSMTIPSLDLSITRPSCLARIVHHHTDRRSSSHSTSRSYAFLLHKYPPSLLPHPAMSLLALMSGTSQDAMGYTKATHTSSRSICTFRSSRW